MGERRAMASAIADKLVKGALCEEVIQRSDKLEGASFYNYERVKEHFIYKVQRPWSMMVCAPQSRALPAPYSPKPWGHRECVYSSASLKMLSSAMASKEEKSAFYYCLVLVSLVCKFSVVSLNWTRKSFWIDLLLWGTELETSSKSGSLGYSQPPQLTSGETDSICFSHWRQTQEPAISRGIWEGLTKGTQVVWPGRPRYIYVLSYQTNRPQWKP